jgi:lysozyme
MKIAIDIIKKFEGCKLASYKCQAGIYTIGYGSTFYENGSKVNSGDAISQQRAESLLLTTVTKFSSEVNKIVKSNVNDNQRSALISFAFNLGVGALKKSTLLKLVNANPNDPQIAHEFMKWVNAGGKPSNGLINRRRAELHLYFS